MRFDGHSIAVICLLLVRHLQYDKDKIDTRGLCLMGWRFCDLRDPLKDAREITPDHTMLTKHPNIYVCMGECQPLEWIMAISAGYLNGIVQWYLW